MPRPRRWSHLSFAATLLLAAATGATETRWRSLPDAPWTDTPQPRWARRDGALVLLWPADDRLWRWSVLARRWQRGPRLPLDWHHLLAHPEREGYGLLTRGGRLLLATDVARPPDHGWRATTAAVARDGWVWADPRGVWRYTDGARPALWRPAAATAVVRWLGGMGYAEPGGGWYTTAGPVSASALLGCGPHLWRRRGATWSPGFEAPHLRGTAAVCAGSGTILVWDAETATWILSDAERVLLRGSLPSGTSRLVAARNGEALWLAAALADGRLLLARVSLEQLPGFDTVAPAPPPLPPPTLYRCAARPPYPDHELWRRLRRAAWAPRLRLRGDYDEGDDADLRWEPLATASSTEELILVGPTLARGGTRRRRAWRIGLEATWELDRLLYDPRELNLLRWWRRAAVDHERRVAYLVELWYRARRADEEGARAAAILRGLCGDRGTPETTEVWP